MTCQACGHGPLKPVLDLGYLPPPNDYRPIGVAAPPQMWMPSELMYCEKCDLVQLAYTAPSEAVFPLSYPYTSGSTKILRDNFANLADEARRMIDLGPDDLVIDIGSNDGTLLSNFKQHRIMGIEPTDVAKIANANGIPTIQSYFNAIVGHTLANHGKAKIVTCANCFAHMPDVHDKINGIKHMLADDGVFISESHYLIDLIGSLQYDTIYHEHLRYYSLNSLNALLEQHGLEIFHVTRIPTHGGSIRVYAARPGYYRTDPTVLSILAEPHGAQLATILSGFGRDVRNSKLSLMWHLWNAKRAGLSVCGISAPSRAATVVNYCRLDASIINRVYEVNSSLKLGKYMPGTNIPVVSEDTLVEDHPAYCVLFSWHIADELIPKLRAKGYNGEFILPCKREVDFAQAA